VKTLLHPASTVPSPTAAGRRRSQRLVLLLAALGFAAAAGAAEVSGRVGTGRPGAPALRVYAWSRSANRLYSLASGTAVHYRLELPPGRYWLFAGLEGSGASPIYGAYTGFVRCSRPATRPPAADATADPDCSSHALTEVSVAGRRLADIDLTDWALDDASATALDNLLGRPPGDPYDESGRAAPKFSEYPARAGSAASAAHDPTGERPADREALAAALGSPPNFAGRLSLVPAGCDGSCTGVALIDHASGTVRYPVALNPLPDAPPCEARATLQYRRDSRLLIVRSGAPKGARGTTTVTYYTVEGDTAELRVVASRVQPEAPGGHCAAPLAALGRGGRR
jgi:hypothetical protein